MKSIKRLLSVFLFSLLVFAPLGYSQTNSTTKPPASEEALVKQHEARLEELEQKLEHFQETEEKVQQSALQKIIKASLIILIGFVLFGLLKHGLKKFEETISEKDVIRESEHTLRLKTLVRLFHWVGLIAIIGTVLYIVLENFGVNVAPLLAGAGIVGLAFGFGGQYLIRDLINGIFILIEGQYNINDVVKIGEFAGVVESINLRMTTLRDAEGRVVLIPNGEIKTVVNLTKDYSRAVLDIGVAYKENVDRVMDVIRQIGKEIRQDGYFAKLILDDLEMLGVENFADSQVTIKFRIKTLPIKQWEVAREMRRRIKNRFDDLEIEIPFPHRTLYIGSGKENDVLKDLAKR